MKKSLFYFSAGLLSLSVVVLFQNCGAPPLEEDKTLLPSGIGFPIETKFDRLAYMSCSGVTSSPVNYKPENFFTFRLGAYYSGSGLKLSQNFINSTRNWTLDEKIQGLQSDPMTADITPNVSLRPTQDPNSFLTFSGRDSGDFLGSLTKSPFVDDLVRLPFRNTSGVVTQDRQNIFGGAPFEDFIGASPLRESSTNASELTHARLRLDLNSDALRLVYSFDNAASPRVYGTAFGKMTFDTVYAHRLLSVYEFDYLAQQSQAWTCDTFYKIVRFENKAAQCPNATLISQTESYTGAMADAQNLFPAANGWMVDPTAGCAVQPENTTTNFRGDCYAGAQVNYTGLCGQPGYGVCPHYVSICKRP